MSAKAVLRAVALAAALAACGRARHAAPPPDDGRDGRDGDDGQDERSEAAPLGAGERVERIPTRPGVALPVLVVEPQGTPSAVVVLFAGGDGRLRLGPHGIGEGGDNFMVRTRRRFADAGFVALVVDVPSDHPNGVGDYRVSQDEAADVSALATWAAPRWPAPLWLVGTSRGTLSAANAVARGVATRGLVLTSSITAGRRERLADVALARIEVPTLLVHNRRDGCGASPFEGARRLEDALVHVRAKAFRAFDGGAPPRSRPCGPLSFHGFYGLDDDAVGAIVTFIREH